MRTKYKSITIIAALFIGFVCFFLNSNNTEARSHRTVTIGQGAGMSSWDPHGHSNQTAYVTWRHIMETLIYYDYEKRRFEGRLAKSWTGKGTEWTFTLRKGVKFHNGADFTARDVKFSLDRIRKGSKQAATLRDVKDVVVLDDYTVKIITKKPFAPFISRLENMVMVSQQVYEQYGEEAIKHPIGTGAFKFVEWVRGSHFVVKGNEAYWGGPPEVDQVIWKPIPEEAARMTALETGAIDVATDVPPHEVERLDKDTNIRVEPITAMRLIQVGMAQRFKPFQNRKVRLAVNHAVDLDSIIKYVLDGEAYRANGLSGPGSLGYLPDRKPYMYDPERAKSLLAEAGYPNGFEVNFHAPSGRYPKDREVAQAISGQLAKVGIKAKVITPEWSVFWSGVRTGKWDMFYFGGFNHLDPDVFLSLYFQTGVTKRLAYSNPEVDKAIAEQRQEFDPEKREVLLRKAINTILDDATTILLWRHQMLYGVRERVIWKPTPEEGILVYEEGFSVR